MVMVRFFTKGGMLPDAPPSRSLNLAYASPARPCRAVVTLCNDRPRHARCAAQLPSPKKRRLWDNARFVQNGIFAMFTFKHGAFALLIII